VPPAARARVRRHASSEARRAQILTAALRCFSEKGYHEATMDDVAREAGLSKGSLYWHFKSKGEVFAGLSGAYSLELVQAWDALAADHQGGVVDLLGRVGAVSIEVITAHGELLRAWAEFIVHREVQEQFAGIYRETRRRLGAWIRQGIADGELRPADPESLAASLTALIEGLLIQTLVDPDFDVRRHWRVGWDAFARGIAA
jgi:TetR/AcrR family acrAB operon transcriptional repressor